MSNAISVFISQTAPTPPWSDKTSLTINNNQASIHLLPEVETMQIQSSIRQLMGLGFTEFKLEGEGWNFERQFAVSQAAFRPKNPATVAYAALEGEQNQKLENLVRCAYWTRTQVNHTPEDLAPLVLAQDAAQFVASFAPENVSYSIVSGEELLDQGLVGIHGVGRGSDRPPALLELDFTPDGWGDAAPIAALVGKGITFDSGGYSLKASESMLHMKTDMGGAATVAGALAYAISQGLNKRVKLYLCCAENLVSGKAYKLGDILKYKNGVSVEIVNTDAEGRLVLADGLILASESGAELIVDAATLTGAAVAAVGDQYNAVFSFDKTLVSEFLNFSSQENEMHWPLPLDPFHVTLTPSAYADTANSRPVKGGGAGGASNAAGFLSRFVAKGRRWLHLDLAACSNNSDTATLSAGGTGKGIRSIARTLLEE